MITREQHRTIYNAARRARRWTEKNWRRYRAVGDMCGMCGVSSTYLLKLLKKEGIRARIMAGDGHAYVQYKGYIIDVTATQFGNGKIVFRKRRKLESSEYRCDLGFRTPEAFIEHQEEVGWASEQVYKG
jgi:hypothetical protein